MKAVVTVSRFRLTARRSTFRNSKGRYGMWWTPPMIVAVLSDEKGRQVQSEKMLDLVISNGKVIRAGNQFGVGSVRP